jgi:tight adherence protein B
MTAQVIICFICIAVPVASLVYITKQHQALASHRQFIKARIGLDVSFVQQIRRQSASALSQLTTQWMARLQDVSWLEGLINDITFAEVATEGKQYVFWHYALPAVLAIVLLALQMPLFALLCVFYGAFRFLTVFFKKSKKLKLSLLQLPDVIGMIANALKAGNSLSTCFAFVAEEMPVPTRQYFHQLHTELQYGISFKQAALKMLKPLDSIPEYSMFVSAVNIQRESGGNLSEVLDILGQTIRERLTMKSKIAALTGQSRLTGYIIGAAPTAVLLFLSVTNYKFVAPLYEMTMGRILLVVAIIMQCIGFYIIKQIVDIKV